MEGDGGDKAHAQLPLGHIHGFRNILSGAAVKARLGRQRAFPAGKVQPAAQEVSKGASLPAAHIEDFQGRGTQHILKVAVQGVGLNGGNLLRFAKPGQAEAVLAAHDFQEPAYGVDSLVVPVCLDGGNEVLFFALHIGGQKAAAFRQGLLKQLGKKLHRALQHPVPGQGKAVIHKAQVQSRGLIVS